MPGLRGVKLTRLATGSRCLIFGMLYVAGFPASAQKTKQPPGPINISVDATDVAQKILHAELSIPATPGALTLYYPKWMPADHSPDGPIWNVVGLKFSSNGKSIPWNQDPVDMYTFHLEVPQGVDN